MYSYIIGPAIILCLIAAFVIFLAKYLGIKLDLAIFIQELRELVSLKITPESLNAMLMALFSIIALFMIFSSMVAGWRRLVYFLLNFDPDSLQVISVFTLFLVILGIWSFLAIFSMCFCLKHRRHMSGDA